MKIRRLSALLATCAFLGFAAPTQAQQFSQVYVFGDSLSDAGYFRPVLGAAGVPPSLLAILGRFTTAPGPVWSELIASHYDAPTGPSNANPLLASGVPGEGDADAEARFASRAVDAPAAR